MSQGQMACAAFYDLLIRGINLQSEITHPLSIGYFGTLRRTGTFFHLMKERPILACEDPLKSRSAL